MNAEEEREKSKENEHYNIKLRSLEINRVKLSNL